MAFRLIVTDGPRKGEEFIVKETIVIGRKQGDLQLQDKKASNPHAKISYESDDLIEIEDLQSANGTFVNGKKITIARIKAGDQILIGKSSLKVEAFTPREEPATPDMGAWQSQLDGVFGRLIPKAEKIPRSSAATTPFSPPLVLEFVGGQQTGERVVFGFGPRQVGAFCTDALLHEIGSPTVAFEVHPAKDALCEIKIRDSSVLLNGTAAKTAKIKNGDRLSVGRTVIVFKALDSL